MSQRTAEEWKTIGNNQFQAKQYQAACESYTNGLELDPQSFHLYCNRSLCHHHLAQHVDALSDALKAIELNKDWIKAYFRAVVAYEHLDRLKEGILLLETTSKTDIDQGNIYTSLCRRYVEQYFKPLTKSLPVQVRYISLGRGRGVFSKRSFKVGEVLYTESPVASYRVISGGPKDAIKACSHSLTETLDVSTLPQPVAEALSKSPLLPSLVPCPHCEYDPVCGEWYASEEVRAAAWSQMTISILMVHSFDIRDRN